MKAVPDAVSATTPEHVVPLAYSLPLGHDLRYLVLEPGLNSTGSMGYGAEYGPPLPSFGSGSLIVDLGRPCKDVPVTSTVRAARDRSIPAPDPAPRLQPSSRVAREKLTRLLALPVAQKVKDLAAALSLNKSQFARVLRVSRPTVYSWLQGTEPGPTNVERLHELLAVLGDASVSGTAPLNARFVRHRPEASEPSILELLSQELLAPDRIVAALKKARELEAEAARRRSKREERLQSRGFEESDDARRRQQLATNMALKPWPK